MVQTKKMNESYFAKILKEFNVAGELIRARQEEKQGLLDDFDGTSKRFFFGKISERALLASVKKTNRELSRLNGEIRSNMAKARRAGNTAISLTSAQTPIGYRAALSGIVGGEKKKAKKRVKAKGKVRKRKAKRTIVRKKKSQRKKR